MFESAYIAQSIDQVDQKLFNEKLEQAITRARDALLALQHPDGYWCFELEADCTISADYILMMHYMDEIDEDIEAKIAVYLRARQGDHGGWPLFYGGKFDISCSVKTYYALKLAGDSPDAPHMVKARNAILAHGGAARCNVFTRITLALFGQLPWRGVPFTPVEIKLLPRWFLFHPSKISYWSRTVMIPLSILCSLKPKAKNPKRVHIRELFTIPPEEEKDYFPVRSHLNRVFLLLDKVGHLLEPLIPERIRRRAVKKAEKWFVERLNGTGGLGAIFPAMVNAHEALDCLGYPSDHPYRKATKQALKDLLIIGDDSAYCQPCVSHVWDTALSCLALQEEASGMIVEHILRALDWLKARQLLEEPGDWRENRPDLKGGGWPFQLSNPHYPDLDDTAAVAWAMHVTQQERYRESVQCAADWICGMQSKNGGFASFDVDNTHYYLNEIPFADHGALLDPPTSDVSARCATLLALLGHRGPELTRCLDFLFKEQEKDGSWFGRWGTNHIYGTWSVLVALEEAGIHPREPYIQRAVNWLKHMQRPDGGWGEDCDSYFNPEQVGNGYASTSFQTAWAMLGLMAAGEVHSPEVRLGAQYLMRKQQADGFWKDEWFTAPGFPRVFYLKYHGYTKYFPLWALARYRNLRSKNSV
ncbi:MAG: squalene--hopene cyclase [Deltaproteobacteria bacterium]|nr:squalene--hopene cyclase [Deltaproteobacteria bacterium]